MLLPYQANELLSVMAQENAWGVSNTSKHPIYTGEFIRTNDERTLELYKDKYKDTLNSLHEIDNHPSLVSITNRAYHMRAQDNLIIVLDIENRTSLERLDYFKSLPAHYSEYSRNKGLHIFYQLNARKLSQAAREYVSVDTVHKYKDIDNDSPLEYELIMNNHWITLTGFIAENPIIGLNQDAPQAIYDLIEHTAANKELIKIDTINFKEESTNLSKKLDLFIKQSDKYPGIKELSVDDNEFNQDYSSYEYGVCIRLASALIYRIEHPRPADNLYLEGQLNDIEPSDIIMAVSNAASEIIPVRTKHTEKRQGKSWLTYLSSQAVGYLKHESSKNK